VDRKKLELPGGDWPGAVAHHAELPTVNTRGEITGVLRANGALRFSK
jgi:hypothetical protein